MARRIAFVLGGALCVWDDLAAARALCEPHVIVAVNDIGTVFADQIDYWVSYHLDQLAKWSDIRKMKGLPPARELWSGLASSRNGPKFLKRHPNRGGSSGMLATCIALDNAEATHVILCGVPIDPEMRHFSDKYKGKPWKDGKNYQRHWEEKHAYFRNRVKSMSGWTAQLLGEPTLDWLKGDLC